uniref:Type I restriction modification DNA specificity domain-containing protein n=1 Tax=Candidatus Kentrum sp. MB TaxID=2138164 RepID=A0A450XVQ5_9GAMM|nr:MAG: Type I restriction modification DNA specificity domain-containing protein [Candidatus Kentron sp. MB]VFK76133.1 MAG: Type I restriction modification DNA specificity domain-containing protein [Candidatus Kentron sp. MB]
MKARQTEIANCAEVLPGCSLNTYARHDPSGSHQVILGKHLLMSGLSLPGMGYRYHPEHELRVTPRGKVEKYSVKAGDVLLVSRGLRNHAVWIESVPEKTIASATFYLLRVHHGIEPAYFAWLLNQAPTQNRIAQIRTSAGTPIIQRKLFTELIIPLPSYEDQCKIAKLGACMVKERILRQTLVERTEQLYRLIGERLIGNLA